MSETASTSSASSSPPTTSSLLRQTLMSVDECFVYKVPPLTTVSGYRANDWNLAQPFETCGFQVERRDNDLYLVFTLENHTKLFALSKLTKDNVQRSVEPVVDSSRYFVTRIISGNSSNNPQQQQQQQREASLGFGFRDRDVAVDLLGNLQQFQKSIEREIQAQNMKVTEIPTLAKGDKMHITIKSLHSASSKSKHQLQGKNKVTTASIGGGGGPFLLKKPPSSAAAASIPALPLQSPSPVPDTVSPLPVEGITQTVQINMSEMETPPPHPMDIDYDDDDDQQQHSFIGGDGENSEAAVATKSIVDDDNLEDDYAESDQFVAMSSAASGITTTATNSAVLDPPSVETAPINNATTPTPAGDNDDDDFGDFQTAS